MPPQFVRSEVFPQIAGKLTANKDLLSLLGTSYQEPDAARFKEIFMAMLPLGVTQSFEVVFGDFSSYCGCVQSALEAVTLGYLTTFYLFSMAGDKLSSTLLDALAARQTGTKNIRKARTRLTSLLGVNVGHLRRANLQQKYLAKLETPYPPKDAAICENNAIERMWGEYRAKTPHPDTRKDRPPPQWPKLVVLDKEKLQYTVGATESVLIRDASDTSKIVAVVIQDFCPVEGVINWVNSVIDKNVGERRNIRVCALYSLPQRKYKLIQRLLAA